MKKNLFGKVRSFVLPIILLLAGLYFVPIKIFNKDFSKMPGDLGDTRFNNYVLEHGYKFLTHKTDKYWDVPFMYPYKNVIALSDNLLGTVPVYSVFRIMGLDRETSFQYWFLAMFALNFICCFWALNKWSNNIILSAVGAYIFAFSLSNVGQIGHAQVFPKFMVPLIFYWFWKYLTEKQLKYFLFTLLAIVYQFYCGIYLGFLSFYVLLFLLIAYFWIYKDWKFFHQFGKIKVAGGHLFIILVAIILLVPLMKPYLDIAKTMGMRKFEETITSIPRLESYFFPPGSTVFWKFLFKQNEGAFPIWWDHYLFLGGLPMLGLLMVPVLVFMGKPAAKHKKFIRCILLGLFLSFIFCLNVDGVTLWRVIFEIPGFSSMRAISRIINTEIMFFIVIFVFVFRELAKSYKIVKWIVFTFPILVVADNLIDPQLVYAFNKVDAQKKTEEIKRNIAIQYNSKYAAIAYMPIYPMDLNPEKWHAKIIEDHLSVMLAAQDLNIPCVNAYSGGYPGNYLSFFDHTSYEALQNWCEFSGGDIKVIQSMNELGKSEKCRVSISVMAANSKFICVEESADNQVMVNRDSPAAWETFSLIKFENGECVLRTNNNSFFCCEVDRGGIIKANRKKIGSWETFTLVEIDKNTIALKADNGKYVSLDKKSEQLFAIAGEIGENEKFKLTAR